MIVFFYAVGADGGESAQAPTAFWDMLPVRTGERDSLAGLDVTNCNAAGAHGRKSRQTLEDRKEDRLSRREVREAAASITSSLVLFQPKEKRIVPVG